ncbi:hypothetical protein, partial [Yersinia intermedia]|uniref:hypothetical protein n=1 Tax=Yersinia intermedia TaxID=631 RepID=UPI001C9440A0
MWGVVGFVFLGVCGFFGVVGVCVLLFGVVWGFFGFLLPSRDFVGYFCFVLLFVWVRIGVVGAF